MSATNTTNRKYLMIFAVFLLAACNKISDGKKLGKADIRRIRQMGILDENENILQFYSQFKKRLAGNFFTRKRLAAYWIDERDELKSSISTAFFEEIIAMDTVTSVAATYAPYILVTKKDGSNFKVYFDGTKKEIRDVFSQAFTIWKSRRGSQNLPQHDNALQKKPIEIARTILTSYSEQRESTDSEDNKAAMTRALKDLAHTKIASTDMMLLLDVWMYYDPTDFQTRELLQPIFQKDSNATRIAIDRRLSARRKWESPDSAPYSELPELRKRFQEKP